MGAESRQPYFERLIGRLQRRDRRLQAVDERLLRARLFLLIGLLAALAWGLCASTVVSMAARLQGLLASRA